MIDAQFVEKLLELHAVGDKPSLDAMREMLRNGGMARLLTLAAKGSGVRQKKVSHPSPTRSVPTGKTRKGAMPENFPDETARDWARTFWAENRRPDLVVSINLQVDQFNDHFRQEGGLMADWPARWRTWCRNALSFTKPPRGADLHVASAAGAFEQTTAAGWVGRLEVFYFGSGQDVPAGFWAPKYGPKPGEAGCKAPPSMVKAAAAAAQRRAAG